ncbi:MAG: hypothetical protein J2P17_08255 [Mycobacterium sp.]|nr:hypothetical protein [Mycobacterium sp.]
MTSWTRLPGTHRPRVYAYVLPHVTAMRARILLWAWRCEEHERVMTGYPTAADAHTAATHHAARRH